jgi:NAD(P)-dependent dehydrogenase (short-subunit alcohol dehydrogenase family)
MSNLKDKVALVSGSGRGIGRAIAHKLARHGAKVVVNDLDEEPGRAVADEIKSAAGRPSPSTAASPMRASPTGLSAPPSRLSAGSTSSSTTPATPGTRPFKK